VTVTQLNDYVQSVQRTLNFSVNENTGQVVVKVVDTNNEEEVILEIPAEDALNLF